MGRPKLTLLGLTNSWISRADLGGSIFVKNIIFFVIQVKKKLIPHHLWCATLHVVGDISINKRLKQIIKIKKKDTYFIQSSTLTFLFLFKKKHQRCDDEILSELRLNFEVLGTLSRKKKLTNSYFEKKADYVTITIKRDFVRTLSKVISEWAKKNVYIRRPSKNSWIYKTSQTCYEINISKKKIYNTQILFKRKKIGKGLDHGCLISWDKSQK